jgi:hypothetical protein
VLIAGPQTDYGSTMVQWMRHRRPKHRGGVFMEAERPSSSYVVDVRVFGVRGAMTDINKM